MKVSELKLSPKGLKKSAIRTVLKLRKKAKTNKDIKDTANTMYNANGLADDGPNFS